MRLRWSFRGRKNSLFAGNQRRGRSPAILASLPCRRRQVDPQLYLTQLLMNLPTWPVHDLDAWLPDQWILRQAAPAATPDQPLVTPPPPQRLSGPLASLSARM